jgi:hypothetical protein
MYDPIVRSPRECAFSCGTFSFAMMSQPSQHPDQFSVTLRSLGKSGRVLYALSQFYLPFYRQQVRFLLYDHYDIFACLSAGIYEIDEMIENRSSLDAAFIKLRELERYFSKKLEFDAYVCDRFHDARRYYRFEDQLLRGTLKYSFDDLVDMTAIRSFDFRILHAALIQLLNRSYDQRLLEWFQWFEMLMEIEDDMLSAKEDMARGTYNVCYLTTSYSAEDGPSLLEDFRCQIESKLNASKVALPHIFVAFSSVVFDRYRKIISRPALPS